MLHDFMVKNIELKTLDKILGSSPRLHLFYNF